MHIFKNPSGSLDHGGAIKRAEFHEAYGNGLDRSYGNDRYCDVGHGLDQQGNDVAKPLASTKERQAQGNDVAKPLASRNEHQCSGRRHGRLDRATSPKRSNNMDMTDQESDDGDQDIINQPRVESTAMPNMHLINQ